PAPHPPRECGESGGRQADLECLLLGRVREGIVRAHDALEPEAVRDQRPRIERARREHPEEHRGRHRIDQARGERDVLRPESLQVQLDALPEDPDVGDVPAGSDDCLADVERGGHADGLDGDVDPALSRELHYPATGLRAATVDRMGRAEPLCGLEAVAVEVEHDDVARRREERRGPAPTMAMVSPGFTWPFRTPHSKPVGKMSLSITSTSSSTSAGAT